MKVFLSWSKPRSREFADALRNWLPLVLQRVEPWMSAADLEAGVKWGPMLSEQLDSTSFGIICVTEENRNEPWLHFEAGAISKKVASPARVVPLAFGFDKAAMPGPLQQFQAVSADEAGVRSIVRSIHACMPEKLPEERLLGRTLDKWLPDLIETWAKVKPLTERPAEPEIKPDEAIKEVLLMMRQLSRESAPLAPATSEFKSIADPLYRVRLVSPHVDIGEMVGRLHAQNCPLDYVGIVDDDCFDIRIRGVRNRHGVLRALTDIGVPFETMSIKKHV